MRVLRKSKSKVGEDGASEFSLDFAAFRISSLTGSLCPSFAGSTNSPLDSQEPPVLESVGVLGYIDYCSIVFKCTSPMRCVDAIEEELGVVLGCHIRDLVEKEDGNWYRISGSFGVTIEFKFDVDGGFKSRISVPGQACRWCGNDKIVALIRLARDAWGGRVTRLDFCADDLNGILELDQIRHMLEQGNYHGYRGGEAIQSYGTTTSGQSVYFGGRKSLSRLRFYDKKAQSGGSENGIRQELQLRGGLSEAASTDLLALTEESICAYVRSRLAGGIVFGVRKGKNLDRTVVAEFWTRWQEILVSRPRRKEPLKVVKSIARSMDWFARTAARTLAILSVAVGDVDLEEALQIMLKYGRSKLDDCQIFEAVQFSKIYDEGELNERLRKMELSC